MYKRVKVNHPVKWEENENIKVTIRYKENKKIHTKKVKLTSIYKIGVEFNVIYYKNGNIKGLQSTGYIIDNEYHRTNILSVYLKKIRKVCRLYGIMAIINETPVTTTLPNGKNITRLNKEYLCKWKKDTKFASVQKEVSGRRIKRNRKE
jgi:hypothetical protein